MLGGRVDASGAVNVGADMAVRAVQTGLVVQVRRGLIDVVSGVFVEDVVAGGVAVDALVPQLGMLGGL